MRSLNEYFLTAAIADLSTASTVYVPVPDDGEVTDVYVCEGAAITTAAATVTVSPNGTSAATISAPVSGSGAGTVVSGTCTSNYVTEGGYVSVATDGGSTGTCPVIVTLVIRR